MRRFLLVAAVLLALPAAADAVPARIAFSTDAGIDVMAADGSGRVPLVRQRRSLVAEPAWSRDGSALAFIALSRDDEAPGRIWVARADGSGSRPLTQPPRATLYDRSPAWSPDGSRIAFVRLRAAGEDRIRSELVTVAASGGDARVVVRLTVTNRIDFLTHVAWAPDGSRLVYTRSRGDRFVPSLWSVAPDGSGGRLLAREAGFASFSPDGRQIAYASIADHNGESCGDECRANGEIYVMNADGSGRRRLTANLGDDSAPAWSPDGARIAFQSTRNYPSGSAEEVYSIASDGSCLTWLTNGTGFSGTPAWEPGADRSSDPGACGATDRPPLVSTSFTRLRAFDRFPVWWVGTRTADAMLLTQADAGNGVSLVYDDCGLFEPAGCPRPVYLNETRSCSRDTLLLYGHNPAKLRGARGAIAYGVSGFGPLEGGTDVYVGGVTINIDAGSRARATDVIGQLRRLDAAAPPARLPAAGFPHRIWRPLDRVAAVHRRLGSVAAVARRLHLDRGDVRERLALRRKLLKLGARRLSC